MLFRLLKPKPKQRSCFVCNAKCMHRPLSSILLENPLKCHILQVKFCTKKWNPGCMHRSFVSPITVRVCCLILLKVWWSSLSAVLWSYSLFDIHRVNVLITKVKGFLKHEKKHRYCVQCRMYASCPK